MLNVFPKRMDPSYSINTGKQTKKSADCHEILDALETGQQCLCMGAARVVAAEVTSSQISACVRGAVSGGVSRWF